MSHAIATLADQDLLAALGRSHDHTLQATVDFLEHLAEVDERRLYLAEACSSMFTYCLERLHLAEGATHRRLTAARAGRRYPLVFAMLRRGEVHLTAVAMLAPLLTPDNHVEVLARAKHQKTSAVEKLVAELAPKPDRADSVRRVAAPRTSAAVVTLALPPPLPQPAAEAACTANVSSTPLPASTPASSLPAGAPPRIKPTAPERYHIHLTGDEELVRLLDEVRDLLGHQLPRNDLAGVFKRAVGSLKDDLLRQRTGRTRRAPTAPAASGAAAPTTSSAADGAASSGAVDTTSTAGPTTREPLAAEAQPASVETAPASQALDEPSTRPATSLPAVTAPPPPSRHVPNHIRREVWDRDGGRCTFVNGSGQRCSETSRLELDQLRPFARYREHHADDITLRCRAHNQWSAVLTYGAKHMAQFRRR